MPSRAEMRVRLEQILPAIVIAALAAMLWQSLHDRGGSGGQAVNARGLDAGALAKWSWANAPETVHVQLANVPSPYERAWLSALAGAGSTMIWSGDLPSLMIDAQPVASPTGGTKAVVASPSRSTVVISDEVGAIDTLHTQNHGATLTFNSVSRPLAARVNGSVASTVPSDSLVLRKILLIGTAGWESKFVAAALEEEGWKVDALIRVAPGADVSQGSAAVIDTSRYSAVVALDGVAAPYANRILEFVRTGGGVVLAPQAASLDAMAPLRAGALVRPISATREIQPGGTVNLATLPLSPIALLRSDAVAIERRAGSVAVAARRIDAGRAIQFGYEDTWRWRMAGSDQAAREHRLWWSGLLGSVAHAQTTPRALAGIATDEAPLIGLVAGIGPTTPGRANAIFSGDAEWGAWLFVILALALISEVASRRLRGAS